MMFRWCVWCYFWNKSICKRISSGIHVKRNIECIIQIWDYIWIVYVITLVVLLHTICFFNYGLFEIIHEYIYICVYVTHSLNPSIVFEERAANKMENRLKLISSFVELEGTRNFPEDLPEVLFGEFYACAVSGNSWRVFGKFTGSK